MSPLKITRQDRAAGPVLHVTGELDYDQAAALREETERLPLRPGQCLVIDLAGLEFCDSTGITALLAARQHAQAAGAEVALAAVPANTLRILTLVGLHQVFTLLPDAGADTGAGGGTGGDAGTA
ncbi:STAS domain-containing protein [Streptomyces zingiberis]|uniref:Anti-sigma factor antagonist n=1 Tax=Streptomyces zingiberis TaxID=2053010 RepID=A0ABX1BRX8_9ACTN|nr:STAS domain-containing protein [Streptomyces zingiberis]NJQ00494.1 STAS domain-containing protein [Streptomyces zingiberis]